MSGINGMNHLPTGAGFLPSTVWPLRLADLFLECNQTQQPPPCLSFLDRDGRCWENQLKLTSWVKNEDPSNHRWTMINCSSCPVTIPWFSIFSGSHSPHSPGIPDGSHHGGAYQGARRDPAGYEILPRCSGSAAWKSSTLYTSLHTFTHLYTSLHIFTHLYTWTYRDIELWLSSFTTASQMVPRFSIRFQHPSTNIFLAWRQRGLRIESAAGWEGWALGCFARFWGEVLTSNTIWESNSLFAGQFSIYRRIIYL